MFRSFRGGKHLAATVRLKQSVAVAATLSSSSAWHPLLAKSLPLRETPLTPAGNADNPHREAAATTSTCARRPQQGAQLSRPPAGSNPNTHPTIPEPDSDPASR